MIEPDRGLQVQRTSLAWTRTAFAVLGNGALLMVHYIADRKGGFGIVAVTAAVLVALAVFLVGVRRQRTLARSPLPSRIAPVIEVYVVTAGVLFLIAVSVISLLR